MTAREKLANFLLEAGKKGFIWGENDCALFANNALVAAYDFPDIGKDFRGLYSDRVGAAVRIRELGYKSVADIANTHLQAVQAPRLGDVVLYTNNKSLGICMGAKSWFVAEKGLVSLPTSKLNKFWRIK